MPNFPIVELRYLRSYYTQRPDPDCDHCSYGLCLQAVHVYHDETGLIRGEIEVTQHNTP